MKKKTILIGCVVVIYFIITLINQQKVLNSYKVTKAEVAKQIEDAKQEKEKLLKDKENANSLEYIETIAREKLNMYYPNERVYVDNTK